MKNGIILAAFMAALCTSAETVKTATQPWVRSYVATNHTDITGKADKTNTYTKAETDAKIVELAPTPDLTAYLRNDKQDNESQIFGGTLSGFGFHADTGRNENGWQRFMAHNGNNAAQSLPEYIASNPWGFFIGNLEPATNYADSIAASFENGMRTAAMADTANFASESTWASRLGGAGDYSAPTADDLIRASTNAAEAVVREKSLGGIWDQQLEVWWTPVMVNGALTYQATTNVDMNAEVTP